MTKEVLTLALEALKYSDTVFYPQTKIAIAAIEKALANHIEDNLVMVAQPTPAEYAMGYAEGFNDACKPQGEPVGKLQEPTVVGGLVLKQGPDYERGFVDGMQKQMQSSVDKAVNAMAQPKQGEPVAYFNPQVKGGFYWAKPTKITAPVTVSVEPIPFYTTPPQRTWVGLTDEEIIDVIHPLVMADMPDEATDYEIARAIEAKLKDKNR
jgi:hypothetical protein